MLLLFDDEAKKLFIIFFNVKIFVSINLEKLRMKKTAL